MSAQLRPIVHIQRFDPGSSKVPSRFRCLGPDGKGCVLKWPSKKPDRPRTVDAAAKHVHRDHSGLEYIILDPPTTMPVLPVFTSPFLGFGLLPAMPMGNNKVGGSGASQAGPRPKRYKVSSAICLHAGQEPPDITDVHPKIKRQHKDYMDSHSFQPEEAFVTTHHPRAYGPSTAQGLVVDLDENGDEYGGHVITIETLNNPFPRGDRFYVSGYNDTVFESGIIVGVTSIITRTKAVSRILGEEVHIDPTAHYLFHVTPPGMDVTGTSAGVTGAMSLVAKEWNQAIDPSIAHTGCCDLSGIARKVGGFRTKLEAAYSDKEHAIKTVFAPEENMQDPTDAKVVAEYKGKGLKTILDYVASTFNRPRPDRHLIEELDPGCYYGQAFSTTLFSTTGKKVVSSGFRIVAEMAAYPDPGRRLIFSGQVTKGTRDVVSRAFEYWRTVTEALQRSFRVAVDQLLGESSVVVDLCGGLKLTDRALDGLIYCALYALLTGLKADPEVAVLLPLSANGKPTGISMVASNEMIGASEMGFKRLVVPRQSLSVFQEARKEAGLTRKLALVGVDDITEALPVVFPEFKASTSISSRGRMRTTTSRLIGQMD